jgi:hypothetical protein
MKTKILFVSLLLFGLATEAEARKLHVAVATFSQSVLPLVVAQEKDTSEKRIWMWSSFS